jgi:hypothetical protein
MSEMGSSATEAGEALAQWRHSQKAGGGTYFRSAASAYCIFFTSGHLDSDNGWNAWSAGIVATSL